MKIKRLVVVLTILTLAAALLPLTAQAVTLKEGTRSQGVEALQQALKSKGYFSATSTGYYGDITVAAVKSYQKDNGLTADGIAGKDTLTALGLMSNADAIKTGTVNISEGLNLRYGPSTSNTLLCELENGSEVEILSESGGWYKIRTSFDIEGYVFKSYIKASGSSDSNSSSNVQQGKVKVNTRLNVRSGPGTSYSIKGYLLNNASVVISDSQNGWYAITSSSGLSGYCSKEYITVSGQSSDNGSDNSGTPVNQTGKVKVNTRLTIRSGPGTSYSAKGYLSNNTSVTISEILDGWYKIQTSSGITGYCSADYITVTGENTGTAETKQGVVNVDTRLTVRSGPGTSYSALGYLNDNASVTIHETSGDWHKITTPTGMSGYCHVDYITIGQSGSSDNSDDSDSSTPSETLKYGMTSNDVVKLQQRLKEIGYFSANCTGYFGTITLSAVKSFQKDNSLDADGIAGPKTLAALFDKNADAKPEEPEEPETPEEPSDETEELIDELLAYAKTFLGTPYVYGANGPDSFDCTGYTCYVFKHFGYSLPRTAYNQGYNNYAPKIEKIEDLKPGDLVFFNTLSDNDLSDHAGIYLGDNMFIHCNSGSSMSVVIQDITNSYYKPRFSWGRRVIS